jgi:GxxExxY protein
MSYEHLKLSELTGKVIACAMEVHREMGNGFQEKIYQKALETEFTMRSIQHIREFHIPVYYKGLLMGNRYVDFLVEQILSVELKAVMELQPAHFAQAINYLEAYNIEIGMLINFGAPSLQFHRLTNKKFRPNK